MQMDGFLTLKGGNVELVGAPETIFVLPIGHVVSSKGEFDVDDESYKAMKAQIAKRGVDLVVDYEHQTLKGCEAPAAGWVKELKLEDGQIKAVVEWTPRGAQYLENKEYRYLSPVVNVRKADNKAIGLHSLALTNTPAIEGMNPIVNSDNFEGGQHSMDIKKLAELLGLSEDATEEQVVEALKVCLAENRSLKETEKQPPENVVANKAVCELLGLKAGAAAEDVTAKIMELKSGKLDVVYIDYTAALAFAAANDDLTVKDIGIESDSEGQCIGVQKGNEDFVAYLNEKIAEMQEQGLVDQYVAEAQTLAGIE